MSQSYSEAIDSLTRALDVLNEPGKSIGYSYGLRRGQAGYYYYAVRARDQLQRLRDDLLRLDRDPQPSPESRSPTGAAGADGCEGMATPTPGCIGLRGRALTMTQSETSDSREQRMRGMVAELEELAARARSHVDVMRSAVQESVRWSQPADVCWARGALDDAIASAAEAERDLRAARRIVGELFG